VRSWVTYALDVLYTTRFSNPSTLSTCISTTYCRPRSSRHLTSTSDSFSSSTGTCCSEERYLRSTIRWSPESSSTALSSSMRSGLWTSLPKMRLKTKSVLGSANTGRMKASYPSAAPVVAWAADLLYAPSVRRAPRGASTPSDQPARWGRTAPASKLKTDANSPGSTRRHAESPRAECIRAPGLGGRGRQLSRSDRGLRQRAAVGARELGSVGRPGVARRGAADGRVVRWRRLGRERGQGQRVRGLLSRLPACSHGRILGQCGRGSGRR